MSERLIPYQPMDLAEPAELVAAIRKRRGGPKEICAVCGDAIREVSPAGKGQLRGWLGQEAFLRGASRR